MKKKRGNGFTLAELLVVVAIIGVLVAVSIPIFTGQLEKARIATDKANVRAAKVAAVAEYLNSGATGETVYFYDAADGVVKSSIDGIKGYGKSTSDDTDADGVPVTGSKANLVKVVVTDASGASYEASWVAGDGSSTGDHTSGDNDESGDGSGGESEREDNSGNTIDQIVKNASTWPVWTEGSDELKFSIERGRIYSYNGSYYVAAASGNETSNAYYQHLPSTDYESKTVEIDSGTVYTSSNYSQNANQLKKGDIYRADDGSLYVATQDITWNEPAPSGDSGNWIKILQN